MTMEPAASASTKRRRKPVQTGFRRGFLLSGSSCRATSSTSTSPNTSNTPTRERSTSPSRKNAPVSAPRPMDARRTKRTILPSRSSDLLQFEPDHVEQEPRQPHHFASISSSSSSAAEPSHPRSSDLPAHVTAASREHTSDLLMHVQRHDNDDGTSAADTAMDGLRFEAISTIHKKRAEPPPPSLSSDTTFSLPSSTNSSSIRSSDSNNARRRVPSLTSPLLSTISDEESSFSSSAPYQTASYRQEDDLPEPSLPTVDMDSVSVPKEDAGALYAAPPTTSSFSSLASDLSRMLWRLERHGPNGRRVRVSASRLSGTKPYPKQEEEDEKDDDKSATCGYCTTFVTTRLSEPHEWKYTWDVVLDALAACSSSASKPQPQPLSSLSHTQMGAAMLNQREGKAYLATVLSKCHTHEKHTRVHALTATTLIQYWITLQREEMTRAIHKEEDGNNNSNNKHADCGAEICSKESLLSSQLQQMTSLVELFFSPLANLAMEGSSDASSSRIAKRTRLSQACLQVAYEIGTVAAEQMMYQTKYDDENQVPSSTPSCYYFCQLLWKTVMPSLRDLWKVHDSWLLLPPSSKYGVSPKPEKRTRVHCTKSVLADWRKITQDCQSQIKSCHILCNNNDNDNNNNNSVPLVVVRNWCRQIVGVRVVTNSVDAGARRGDTENRHNAIVMGSLTQTLCSNHLYKQSPEDISDTLRFLVDGGLEGNNGGGNANEIERGRSVFVQDREDYHRTILRGVVAWLGQGKGNLSLLLAAFIRFGTSTITEPTPTVDDNIKGKDIATNFQTPTILKSEVEVSATGMLLKLFRLKSAPCSDLLMALFNHLWSNTDGLPRNLLQADINSINNKESNSLVRSSFQVMLDELKLVTNAEGHTNYESLECSTLVLCSLIARCILRKGQSLLTALLASNNMHPSTVEILVMVLQHRSDHSQVSDMTGDHLEQKDSSETRTLLITNLYYVAGDIFMENIRQNEYIQRRMKNSPGVLSGLPLERTVPKLLLTLAREVLSKPKATDLKDSTNSFVVAVTSLSLFHILETSLLTDANNFVRVLVDTLLVIEEKHSDSGDEISLVCSACTNSWRQYLLSSVKLGDTGYATILSATGNAMFRMPSSTVPLSLLGALLSGEDHVPTGVNRIFLATSALVKISVSQLQSSHDNEKKDDKGYGLFQRLSPLLLLRRIPTVCFRLALSKSSKISVEDSDVYVGLLGKLANEIAIRLGVNNISLSQQKIVFTAEERRLSAEIAARSLPFSSSPFFPSCFDHICYPALSNALQDLKAHRNEPANLTPDVIRTAKVALYTACHYIPLAKSIDDGGGPLAVASFAMQVLLAPPNSNFSTSGKDNGDELIQLQTGCIDFFAVCLESASLLTAVSSGDAMTGCFVTDGISSSNVHNLEDESLRSTPFLRSMTNIYVALAEIVQLGETSANWVHNKGYFDKAPRPRSEQLRDKKAPISTRTCIINSFLVVSQRCSEKDGQLDIWAKSVLPWLVEWGSGGKVDDDLRHPLCMAAALQVTFILITRTKSIRSLVSDLSSSEKSKQRFHGVFRWALDSLNRNIEGGVNDAHSAMRMASLKLLLAIFSLLRTAGRSDARALQNCLNPTDMDRANSVLKATAIADTDPDIRALASHFLVAFLHSNTP